MKNLSDKKFRILLIAGVLLIAVALAFIVVETVKDGGKTAEDALWEYEKACMLYKPSKIIAYSSEYRIFELSGGKEMSKSTLKKMLEEQYSKATSPYLNGSLTFELTEKTYIDKEDSEFDGLALEYTEFGAKNNVDRFALVSGVITYNGKSVLKPNAYIAKINGRWYFFKYAV